MSRLLPIDSCLYCKHCVQTKDYKTDLYTGHCSHGFTIDQLTYGTIAKLIWITEVNQCVTGRIPEWCPLEEDYD